MVRRRGTNAQAKRLGSHGWRAIMAIALLGGLDKSDAEGATASRIRCLGASNPFPFDKSKEQDGRVDRSKQECGLYMAESTVPNSGLGIYTGRSLTPGGALAYGDVVLQVTDFEVNNHFRRWYHNDFTATAEQEEELWTLDDYFWQATNTLGSFDAIHAQSILPGVGMLANSYPGLANVAMLAPSRTANLHRGRDPGAGASTTYHNNRFRAIDTIEPGAEIFADYGSNWFASRTEELGEIPLRDDYRNADLLLEKFESITKGDIDTPLAEQTWDLLQSSLKEGTRATVAMPVELTDVPCALETGTAKRSHPNRYRSFEWLEQNGQCLDNIRSKKSTIQQAGGGAFATRPLQKGQVIAPMPMTHFRRHQLEIYDSPNADSPSEHVRRTGTQLLLNYAYGHPESSLLLFPYSPIVNYVNHNATGFNAELRWSTMPSHKTSWLSRTPEDLQSETHTGLIMNMVATRVIEADEEVLLSYGSDYDVAWKNHVDRWSPTPEDERYVSATELNQNVDMLKTRSELTTDGTAMAALAKVYTVCFLKLLDKESTAKGDSKLQWEHHHGLREHAKYAHECDVVERKTVDAGVVYTVVVKRAEDDHLVLTGVPRSAIRFVDEAYTADQFLRKAFRHEIGIPDHLIPPAWRDLSQSQHQSTVDASQVVDGAFYVPTMAYQHNPRVFGYVWRLPMVFTLAGIATLFVLLHRTRSSSYLIVVQCHNQKRDSARQGAKGELEAVGSPDSPDESRSTRNASAESLLRHRKGLELDPAHSPG